MSVIEFDHLAIKVRARGRFNDKDAVDFVPTPESPLLYVDTPYYDGPLDLLLHLIRKHSIDIFDIPIGFILEKYLLVLDDMDVLNLDVAGEFLMMAATLAQIKSKMLLPNERTDDEEMEEEGEDPRAGLIKKLLLYKSFTEVGQELMNRSRLGEDVFFRGKMVTASSEENTERKAESIDDLAPLAIFDLLDSLSRSLKKSEGQVVHTVTRDRISVSVRIQELMDYCKLRMDFSFYDALRFFVIYEKIDVIVTFLALLEMSRLKLLRISKAPTEDLTIHVVKENFYIEQNTRVDDNYG